MKLLYSTWNNKLLQDGIFVSTPPRCYSETQHQGLKPSLIPISFPCGDFFGAASHNTPSKIEQREFCDVIPDYVTKSAALKISFTLPSRSGDALCRWWRRTLMSHNGITQWLYILSSFEIQEVLPFPFPCPMTVLSLLFHCTVTPQYSRTQSLFRLFNSVNVLFRHTACIQSESLLILVDREPWDRVW